MKRGRVLVIEGDETVATALGLALEARGYAVTLCNEAQHGFKSARATDPDCILCNPDLPDIDGAWVARKVRTDPSSLSKVPFLFVGEVIDTTVRTQALAVGVDVFLARPPVTNDEIVAQVDALIAMARRIEGDDPPPSSITAAIRGDLSAFPLASMLMMFEMERRSGTVFVVAENGKRATLTLTGGLFASTEVDGVEASALVVLRDVLSWRSGRFSFSPRQSGSLPPPNASVGALVLEAMRLEDEEKSRAEEIDSADLFEAEARRDPPVPVDT